MTKSIITTYSGRDVDLLDFKPEDIDVTDIVHSLTNQNRYNGHTSAPWSVAQHSIICPAIYNLLVHFDKTNWDENTEKYCLIHDVPETWYQDLCHAVKYSLLDMSFYKSRESYCMVEVSKFFGCNLLHVDMSMAKKVDQLAYMFESSALTRNFDIRERLEKFFPQHVWDEFEEIFWLLQPHISQMIVELVQMPKEQLRQTFFESLMVMAYEADTGRVIPETPFELSPALTATQTSSAGLIGLT